MKIKVCGMKFRDNLQEIAKLQPDYFGFIFYEKSSRYMAEMLLPKDLRNITAKKTGVFVNHSFTEIENAINHFQLDAVQLHGQETPGLCERLKEQKIEVIKVFSVDDSFDFSLTEKFKKCADYFLFDTKGRQSGGNGFSFNWRLLENYHQEVPFFLSGGIGTENIEEAIELQNMNLYGIDINSRVEISPGVKDLQKVQQIILKLKTAKI